MILQQCYFYKHKIQDVSLLRQIQYNRLEVKCREVSDAKETADETCQQK